MLRGSYDPDNEENNYHLLGGSVFLGWGASRRNRRESSSGFRPDHLQRRLQLKHWRQVRFSGGQNIYYIHCVALYDR